MRERGGGSRLRLWLVFGADRAVVTGFLLGAVFLSLVTLGALDPTPLRQTMASGDPVETTFQAFLAAIITAVTLVVTLNQLVLSQELGAVGDQRERMRGAMTFRADVADVVDAPTPPPSPAAFLRAVIDATRTRADDVAAAVEGSSDDELRGQTAELVDDVAGNADAVIDRLTDAQFGTFTVVFAALDYNYSWKIYEARRIRNAHADSLSAEATAAFDDLLEVLELFGSAREHIKTLYFQWELIALSRTMLYTAVPALVTSTAMILFVNSPGTVTGVVLGVDVLVWLVATAVSVTVLPFLLLLAYMLRISTVAKRTLAIGPFILRESRKTGEIDSPE